jgi:hypothetical protein
MTMSWCAATASEKLPASSVSAAGSSARPPRVDDDSGSSSSSARQAEGSSKELAIAGAGRGGAAGLIDSLEVEAGKHFISGCWRASSSQQGHEANLQRIRFLAWWVSGSGGPIYLPCDSKHRCRTAQHGSPEARTLCHGPIKLSCDSAQEDIHLLANAPGGRYAFFSFSFFFTSCCVHNSLFLL